MDNKELVDLSLLAKDKAYAPYSKFKVGSTILTTKGLFSGANVENGSSSMTMCAERVAFFQAIFAGCRSSDFLKIAIVAESSDPTDDNCIVPCGACLQALSEMVSPDMPVLLGNKNGVFREFKFKELLPVVFKLDTQHNH